MEHKYITCDRCGKKMENFFEEDRIGMGLLVWRKSDTYEKNLDLCGDCRTAFEKFMRNEG